MKKKSKKPEKPKSKAEKPKAEKVVDKVVEKAVAVVKPSKAVAAEAEERRKEAKINYNDMQRSWFFFAKNLLALKGLFKELGFSSFKELCFEDYPTIAWPTIIKYISIAENWGKAIEDRLAREKGWQLPAYESCYRLVVLDKSPDKISKEELAKLRKQVLDSKLSYHDLIERLKEYTDKARTKMHADVDRSTEDIERQLEEDIRRDRNPDDGFVPEREETLGEEEEEDDDDVKASSSPYPALESRMAYLLDNLPLITKKLNAKTITDETVELAKVGEELAEALGKFLNKTEEASSG